ncbi:MAG: DNA helicase [Hyphomicrobium sp.]|uniref:AAA domain-containing protein n=1 Tax=Hyphomicrobium sp. TaxID=82 RepID=UPI0013238E23|nr:AAA domain-containing protein [Hyphomicrobium sp.]KAB2943510.1 MAG: DNA helicase [Hyphomicrobium sp.]MBZ0208777.1 DNA helicase [Hyphomicrobium sp.]
MLWLMGNPSGKTSQKRRSLDARFEFDGDGVTTRSREALGHTYFEVTDRQTGEEFCLKLWRKTGSPADAELREIWRHEMRHVQRVMSHAGAHDVVVDLVEFVEDENDFGVLMQRAGHPLSDLLERCKATHWLRSLGIPAHRARLWQNVRRIAIALGVVHAQGLVHGRVSEDVIFTEGGSSPDFRLTGFEWSLWLDAERRNADPPTAAKALHAYDGAIAFVDDWKALGAILCHLLGIVVDAAGIIGPQAGRDVPFLSKAEQSWLRHVCRPRPRDSLEAQALARQCSDIAVEVGATASRQQGRLTLLLRPKAGLARAVYDATAGAIPVDERAQQIAFARADLDAGATLLAPARHDIALLRLDLVTQRLVYRLRPHSIDGEETWDIAVCEDIKARTDTLPGGAGLRPHALDVAIDVASTDREAEEYRTAVGRAGMSWEAIAGTPQSEAPDTLVIVKTALNLLEIVGAVIKSLDVLPIEILAERTGDHRQVVVRALPGNDRDAIAQHIGIAHTSAALQRLFEQEERDSGVRWRISGSGRLGASRAQDVAVTYVGNEQVDGLDGYCFNVEGSLPMASSLYLRPEQEKGTEQQIKRRMRNIDALDARLDLVEMLHDPWRARRRLRHAQLDETSATFARLDDPKQKALRHLWSTAPGFLVVGPPGVGKTTLATATVETIFRHDAASRLLICAQGHDALNHIEEKIAELKDDGTLSEDLLLVRSMAADGKVSSPRRVDKVADAALHKFRLSSLVNNAPSGLRAHVDKLAAATATEDAENEDSGVLWSLMLEAANIVVTTLNSGDVARMVAAQESFDWVVVEEAGKATGPELAGALALGNRRLLIGDHRQLPPFDAAQLERVFCDATVVKKMVANAPDAVGPLFNEAVLEQLGALLRNDAHKAEIQRLARELIEPFKSIVEEDERRAVASAQPQQVAATLTKQRRMDPAIAEIVSAAFYAGKLETDAQRQADAATQPPPVDCSAALTASPVVVVDFPHVSATHDDRFAERSRPKWHNPAEADAVIEVLRHLAPAEGKRPSLAILSPYTGQVALLEQRLALALKKDLAHIRDGFVPVRKGMGLVGTVDSFQGSEADVVVISLVRNNPRVGVGALGFLRERRRMNVMLSRAKHKLILVGSLAFLREAALGVNPDEAEHPLDFILTMLATIDKLRQQERRPGLPLATIIAPRDLRRRR